jgi:hypothetical protein
MYEINSRYMLYGTQKDTKGAKFHKIKAKRVKGVKG